VRSRRVQRAVVLVVQHSARHSVGLVLNHRSLLAVDDLHVDGATKATFDCSALRLGGTACQHSVLLLHGESRVADAHAVCPGLYTGGLRAARRLVRSGDAPAERFCLLAGYTAWPQGALEREVAVGQWAVVSAAPRLVLDVACDEERNGGAWHELFSYVAERERTYELAGEDGLH
jgi:putative transcriptional regulator